MDFKEAMKASRMVADAIPTQKSGKPWDKKTRFISIVDEVGELANALLLEHIRKRAESGGFVD